MRRLLIVNNIPTPYRTFMFNKMWETGRHYGIDVVVAFQAERLSYRPWNPDEAEMRFPHFTSTGANPFRTAPLQRFTYLTLSTDIVREVAFGGYDWVLLAPFLSLGSWASSLVPSRSTRKLLWSEGNLASARFLRGPPRWFKGVLEAPFSAVVCPGQRALDYVLYLNSRLGNRPVLWLPNIVDTSIYGVLVEDSRAYREETRLRLGIAEDEVLILGVGQMIQRKGYRQLLEAAALVQGKYHIVLLGDGPLREEWTRLVDSLRINERVHLRGEAGLSELVRHLAAADWFVHPALRDPSPLAVVEAAIAGLPLAISTQTGNAPEAVVEGVNGFRFDPLDTESAGRALKAMLATTKERRRSMGKASAVFAIQRFDPKTVVDRFFQDLTAMDE